MKLKLHLLCGLLGLSFALALPAHAAGESGPAKTPTQTHKAKTKVKPASTVAIAAATPALLTPETAQAQPVGTENGYPDVNPVFAFKDGRMLCGSQRQPMDIKVEAADDQAVLVTWNRKHYLLKRKPTSTGAYHFDDAKVGFVLIQIPAKSMLFDKKNMTRLADDCVPIH
ncbi:MAG: hypothetical protein B7Z83_10445 [Thiomonas sp. 20-64-5]|nr:MAG: hypothetical protein B7Z83_10445 [Thiomonas sp. 20-64-5]